MDHQAPRETRAALGHQGRKALEGSLGSRECQGLRERRVTPAKYVQRCLKGSRISWDSLENQVLKGNQVILLQPGKA